MRSTARPLQSSREPPAVPATDVQETMAMELSPIAKEWIANPPKEIPLGAGRVRRLDGTTLDSPQLSAPSAEAPLQESPEPSAPSAEAPPQEILTSDTKANGETSDKGDAHEKQLATGHGEDDGKEPQDLFLAEDFVTRKQQQEEKTQVCPAGGKDDNAEGDQEEEKGLTKQQKAAKTRERKKLAKGEAKAKAKAKAQEKKEKKAAAKAKKAAARKEKAKAKKEEKKAKKAAASKAKAKAKSKAKARTTKRKADAEIQDAPEQDAENPPKEPLVPAEASGGHEAAPVPGDGEGKKKTFAGRFRPSKADPVARFDALREVFERYIHDRVRNACSLEVQGVQKIYSW